MSHAPFELSRLISPEDIGSDLITAILLHGPYSAFHERKAAHWTSRAANRIILGTEKGALLVFDLTTGRTCSAAAYGYALTLR